MVIFHARPCREYPILCKEIDNKCNNYYQFHEPFEICEQKDYIKRDGILNYSPTQKLPRKYYFSYPNSLFSKNLEVNSDLNGLKPMGQFQTSYDIRILYGIFSRQRILVEKKDFLFTIIDNPIDMIYNGFYYCQYITSTKIFSMVRKLTGRFFQMKIENFIDLFLDGKFSKNFLFNGRQYKMINELFYIGDLSRYNYIIFRESLESGISTLNYLLKTQIRCVKIESKIIKNCSYRRDDMELFLKNDLNEYNTYKNRFIS